MAYYGAIYAAQKAQEEQEAEEETMGGYTDEELADGWEFKIVRSSTREFHKPDVLRGIIEQESLAGWELLEKFDDQRVRFKRPVSARAYDHELPPEIDPYRTQYGWSSERLAFTIVGAVIAGLVAVLALVAVGQSLF